MPIVPVADFVPDQAAYGNAGMQVATNTLPRENGADTPLRAPNADLRLVPAGTGQVMFGTYTGTTLSPAGYITIKDATGTTRRLLVG
jgi:hypothetical protein